MNPDTYVYCTECAEFRLDDEALPYCPYEDKCDINNFEDSMTFKDRPFWKKKENICQMCFETSAMAGSNVCKACWDAINE